MQINASTDYAIRLLLCLAKASVPIPSSKLAAAIGVSSRYLLQIGARLRDADLICVTHGPAGGFSLNCPPGQINLYDVIHKMERQTHREKNERDERFQILHTAYAFVEAVIVDILKSITIESLLSQSIEKWYLAPYLIEKTRKAFADE